MEIPETLERRLALFKTSGQAFQKAGELFRVDSWTQVMLGQGITPKNIHHFAYIMPEKDLSALLKGIASSVDQQVEHLPEHHLFVKQYCGA